LSRYTHLSNQQIKTLYQNGKIEIKQKGSGEISSISGPYEDGLSRLIFPDEEDIFIEGEILSKVNIHLF
jgi:hypothetical protein